MFTSSESTLRVQSCTFCRTGQRVIVYSEIKALSAVVGGKPSLNRAESYI